MDEILHLENVAEYLQAEVKSEVAKRIEIIEAASDFARLVMIEHFLIEDIAVLRAYERLRLSINAAN